MIRKYLDDRIELTTQDEWSGGSPDRGLILEIAEGTLEHHERFAEEIYVEMVAMADAAGITPAEAVVVGGFTDLIDVVRSAVGMAPIEHNCTAVLNPEAGFFAQTWDMHASAGEFVIMLKVDPIAGPCAVVQTTAGCLGQIGMNEAGISIGINNLTSLGRPGVTWPFVVRKVLEQTDLDSAVEVVTGAELAGRTSTTAFVHANHCLDDRTAEEEGERLPEHVENSNMRLDMATELADDPEAFFAEALISRRVDDPHDVGTCGAVIIEPGKRRMKAVWGVPGDHPWETFQL